MEETPAFIPMNYGLPRREAHPEVGQGTADEGVPKVLVVSLDSVYEIRTMRACLLILS